MFSLRQPAHFDVVRQVVRQLLISCPKLYIPSTLNIDLILWHTQLIVCAGNVKSWFKSWIFHFTFQAYILPNILNCMGVSLFKFELYSSFSAAQNGRLCPDTQKYEFHLNCLEHSICISLQLSCNSHAIVRQSSCIRYLGHHQAILRIWLDENEV